MTISTPQISVIVAVYNQPQFVPGLLSSLEAQDCPAPYEVIVCDDGSIDTTRDLICSHRRSSALDLRYIWQPDRGFNLSRSRNNGIRCAQGDILVFVDGDNWFRPFFLREHWEAHGVDRRLVCGAYQNIELSADNIPLDCASLFNRISESESTDLEARLQWIGTDRPWMACTGGNHSVRKKHAVFFDEQFQGWGSEDRDFAFRLYDAGLAIHLLGRTGLVQLRLNNLAVDWNPCKGGDQHSIVSSLYSKLHLYRKYPGELMMPSLNQANKLWDRRNSHRATEPQSRKRKEAFQTTSFPLFLRVSVSLWHNKCPNVACSDLELVRHCRLDEATDTWQLGPKREDVSVATILAQFETWVERRNSSGCYQI